MNLVSTKHLLFGILIATVLAFAGCGRNETVANQKPNATQASLGAGASRPTDPATQAPEKKDDSFGVWFEPLLQRPYVPSVSVAVVPAPDRKSFYILGRDGELVWFDGTMESIPLAPRDPKPLGFKWKAKIRRVKLDNVFAKGDLGSIGIALDPDFEENKFIYIWYADKADENVLLDRITWVADDAEVLKSRVNVIKISREKPPAPYHMGGIVFFLPDKTMIIGIGDAERPELSQNKKNLNGKFIRIRPRKGPEGGYEVPPDNPYVEDPEYLPEIASVGLRAPFRGFFHENRELIFGDVGSVFEEVDVWDLKPRDFGWGRAKISDGPAVDPGVVPPILHWTHQQDWAKDDVEYAGETRVSSGVGLIYDPKRVQDRYNGQLTGKLIFFDIMRGWVRAGAYVDGHVPEHQHIGHCGFITHMIQGTDGFIYGTSYARPNSFWRMRCKGE